MFETLILLAEAAAASVRVLEPLKSPGANRVKEHYAGKGKPRIISLYTELTSLSKLSTDSVTDYVIKGETTATALRNAGETVSDGLLIAMILKGLPVQYKPFEVVITQNDKNMTFIDFKVALRNFEDTENARGTRKDDSVVMRTHFGYQKHQKQVIYYKCGQPSHKSNLCESKENKYKVKRWCSNCNMNNHTNKNM